MLPSIQDSRHARGERRRSRCGRGSVWCGSVWGDERTMSAKADQGVIGCLLTAPRVKVIENCTSSRLGANSRESFGYQTISGLRVIINLA